MYIQDVSRLQDITAGGDFLGLCNQKSSYKYVSDFGRLRSYGHFLISVHALVWTASHETSWRVMYSAWWLIFCVASVISASWHAQFTTEGLPLLRPAVAFSKNSFKHRSIQIKGRGRVGCLRRPTLPLSIRINTGSLYRNVSILNYKRDKDNVS